MPRKIPLPRGWRRHTKSAIVQILPLSHYAFTAMLARAATGRNRITEDVPQGKCVLTSPSMEVSTSCLPANGPSIGGVR